MDASTEGSLTSPSGGTNDGEGFPCLAAAGLNLVPTELAQQSASQGGLRRDDDVLRTPCAQFQAACIRPQEDLPAAAVIGLEDHRRGQADRSAIVERAQGQIPVAVQSAADFLGAVGLPLGDVGGFQAGGVILVVGKTLFVRGRGVGGLGRLGQDSEVAGQGRDDFLEERLLVHGESFSQGSRRRQERHTQKDRSFL